MRLGSPPDGLVPDGLVTAIAVAELPRGARAAGGVGVSGTWLALPEIGPAGLPLGHIDPLGWAESPSLRVAAAARVEARSVARNSLWAPAAPYAPVGLPERMAMTSITV